jgi:hypothetical protein
MSGRVERPATREKSLRFARSEWAENSVAGRTPGPANSTDDDVEARVAEDSWHVGTYGLIWFAHPYSVEYNPNPAGPSGLWRGVCRCGWAGANFLHQIGAELDAEAHPAHAAYPAERAS